LSTCGERLTVNFSIRLGSGIGPRTCAPVRFAIREGGRTVGSGRVTKIIK
jgi:translation elongation factor EF-Tu-like GTPase